MEAIFGALNAIYGRLGAIEIQQFASEASASDRHKMNILMQYKNLCEMRCHFFEISCSQTENELSLNEWYVRTHLMEITASGTLGSAHWLAAGDPSKQGGRTW